MLITLMMMMITLGVLCCDRVMVIIIARLTIIKTVMILIMLTLVVLILMTMTMTVMIIAK